MFDCLVITACWGISPSKFLCPQTSDAEGGFSRHWPWLGLQRPILLKLAKKLWLAVRAVPEQKCIQTKENTNKIIFICIRSLVQVIIQFCKHMQLWLDLSVQQLFLQTLPPKISQLNYRNLQVLQCLEIFLSSHLFTSYLYCQFFGVVQHCGQLSCELHQDIFNTFALKCWPCRGN